MNSKHWGAALSALLVLATLSVRPATAVDPYEINAIVSLTGPGSFLGKNEQAALALVESSVNKSGGIAGRPIKFVVADDQSSPQVAVQLTNPLIAKKVPLIIGSSLVGACNAMASLVKESGPVLYCLSAGMHPDRSNPYSFTYGVPTDDLILANLRYLRLRGLRSWRFSRQPMRAARTANAASTRRSRCRRISRR
jgi:branched-chain amino acid transport system substrate-binding protein